MRVMETGLEPKKWQAAIQEWGRYCDQADNPYGSLGRPVKRMFAMELERPLYLKTDLNIP